MPTENFPKFLVLQPTDANRSLSTLSPFVVEKVLKGSIGENYNAKKLTNGSLLVEIQRKGQSDNLLKMTSFFEIPVTVTPHRSLNSSKAVIRSRELAILESSELREGLQSQGVTEVKNFYFTKDGTKQKSNTILLTFSSPTPPDSIKAGYIILKTEPYIPNPLRCLNCQRYGHHKDKCKRAAACPRCSVAGHAENDCTAQLKCANCSGDHAAYSSDCETWKVEKQVCKIKATLNVSYPEARKIVNEQDQNKMFNSKPTYASAVFNFGKTFSSTGTQTDGHLCTQCLNIQPTPGTQKNTLSVAVQSQTNTVSNETDTLTNDSSASQTNTEKKTVTVQNVTGTRNQTQIVSNSQPNKSSSTSHTNLLSSKTASTQNTNHKQSTHPKPKIQLQKHSNKSLTPNFVTLDNRFGSLENMETGPHLSSNG
jgi:hypothetical protein